MKNKKFRNFYVETFNNDLSTILVPEPLSLIETNNDINQVYENFESKVTEVIDKHVPTKQMCRKVNQLPYMNRDLRKAIYNKKMYYNKYLKCRNSRNWELYRKCRNLVNKL